MQHLQHQLNKRNEDYGRLVRLFGALQSGSEEQATGLLARLRRGESLDSLVGRVEASSSSTSSSSSRLLPASSSSVQYVSALETHRGAVWMFNIVYGMENHARR